MITIPAFGGGLNLTLRLNVKKAYVGPARNCDLMDEALDKILDESGAIFFDSTDYRITDEAASLVLDEASSTFFDSSDIRVLDEAALYIVDEADSQIY